MKRTFPCLTVALVFCVLSLLVSTPYATRTAKAAALKDRCNDCLILVGQHYEQCQKNHPLSLKCDEKFNEDVIHCYRNFCEQ